MPMAKSAQRRMRARRLLEWSRQVLKFLNNHLDCVLQRIPIVYERVQVQMDCFATRQLR